MANGCKANGRGRQKNKSPLGCQDNGCAGVGIHSLKECRLHVPHVGGLGFQSNSVTSERRNHGAVMGIKFLNGITWGTGLATDRIVAIGTTG